MARKTLINRKTRKEFTTMNPDFLLKKYPNTFIVKPGVELDPEVLQKAEEIAKTLNDEGIQNVNDDVKDISDVHFEEVKPLKDLKRPELDQIAIDKGLDPTQYKNKNSLIKALNNL